MKRVPVNLASNPIEQRQWLRRIQMIAVAVVVLITLAHGALAWMLQEVPATVAPDATALRELRDLSAEVDAMATAADPRGARNVALSVGLANALIEQRRFPWGGLFTMLEDVLPDDVRLEIIQPVVTLDGVQLTLTAASPSEDALLAFLSALEQRPELIAVFPGRQMLGNDGDLRLSINATARVAPASPDAAGVSQ